MLTDEAKMVAKLEDPETGDLKDGYEIYKVLSNPTASTMKNLITLPSGLSRKDIVHMASAFGKNLPKFDSTKGNAEGYVRAVVELIQQMGLQNYPNEMLTYLGKNLGSGTAEGNVIDGLMDRAKEQATEILVQQRRSDGEIGAMTHTRNPKFGEYRV